MMLRLMTRAAIAVAAALWLAPAQGQPIYPTNPVHLVVPFAAGGAADMVARLIGQSIGEKLGQSIVVENRPGATGTIGSLAVARAAPDGYTILMTVISSHAVQPVLKKQPPFDPIKDFTPIVRIANSVQTLVARNNLPVTSAAQLIDYARQNPGKLNYGSSGVGSFPHLGGKMIERAAQVEMVHVPFAGDAPAMTAIVSQDIDILFTPSARSYVENKSVKLVGVSSLTRSPLTPDWPTLDETGLPGFELVSWVGFMGPARTPTDIVARLNQVTNEALANPAVREKLGQIGYSVAGGSPEDYVNTIKDDIARFKALNITID
jgi:tripartite-type tricarboxylate transporter receptor subunit TctC